MGSTNDAVSWRRRRCGDRCSDWWIRPTQPQTLEGRKRRGLMTGCGCWRKGRSLLCQKPSHIDQPDVVWIKPFPVDRVAFYRIIDCLWSFVEMLTEILERLGGLKHPLLAILLVSKYFMPLYVLGVLSRMEALGL